MAGLRFGGLIGDIVRRQTGVAAGLLLLSATLIACSGGSKGSPTSAPAVASLAATGTATAAMGTATAAQPTAPRPEPVRARATGTPGPLGAQATPAAGRKGKGGGRDAQLLTTEMVLKAFKRRGHSIGATTSLTATSDPDGLLGTPGRYTEKLLFADTSLGAPSGVPTVDDGGAIEIFASARDAAAAKQALLQAGGAGTVSQRGNVVLLLSSRLPADQVSSYEIALKKAFAAARKQAIRAQVQQQATPTPTPTPAAP